MCRNCNLTPKQHQRLALLAPDLHVVGWDPAYRSDGLCAGPLIEDPLAGANSIRRLSPKGKLLNNPSADAVEAVWARRERMS